MTRIEQKIAAFEKRLKHVEEPDPIIIYPNEPGEPERSVERFKAQYPDYGGLLIVLPNNDRDD